MRCDVQFEMEQRKTTWEGKPNALKPLISGKASPALQIFISDKNVQVNNSPSG
jgi:hypothetical protein